MTPDKTNTNIKAGILFGGGSRRMGRPKQLLQRQGSSLLRHQCDLLLPFVDEIVLLGQGPLPDDLPPLTVLPDPPDIQGPLAGLLSALRHAPDSAWLLCACDMSEITAPAISWLLSQTGPGVLAVLPRLAGANWCEPLFAFYAAQVAPKVEALARRGELRPAKLAGEEGVAGPTIPSDLSSAWANLNHPGDLPGDVAF